MEHELLKLFGVNCQIPDSGIGEEIGEPTSGYL